jgi:hypothetical protein
MSRARASCPSFNHENRDFNMAEKANTTANVSNGSTPVRPPIKTQDTDKDLDDYFVCTL